MPFGKPFDKYYTEIYEPAVQESGLKSRRADSLFRPSPIIRDIWEYINSSKILIADITGLNPNVMYELGLAHAIAKPVIIVSDSIENVPFDLRFLRILLYDVKDPLWSNNLKESIIKSIEEIIESPMDSVLPAFLNIKPMKKETEQVSAEIIELKQLILSQLSGKNQEKPKRKVTSDLLRDAKRDSKRLYFDDGWAINDIKEFLVDKYEISKYMADHIFHDI